MRAVVQRVSEAYVDVAGEVLGRIGRGLVVLLGVGDADGPADADYIGSKIAGLRIFEDDQGKMNLSVHDAGGEVLLISQFTLYGDCRKGRRPSFSGAAPTERAKELYEAVGEVLRRSGLTVRTGRFQAMMKVGLVNDGPVTLLLDSAKEF